MQTHARIGSRILGERGLYVANFLCTGPPAKREEGGKEGVEKEGGAAGGEGNAAGSGWRERRSVGVEALGEGGGRRRGEAGQKVGVGEEDEKGGKGGGEPPTTADASYNDKDPRFSALAHDTELAYAHQNTKYEASDLPVLVVPSDQILVIWN